MIHFPFGRTAVTVNGASSSTSTAIGVRRPNLCTDHCASVAQTRRAARDSCRDNHSNKRELTHIRGAEMAQKTHFSPLTRTSLQSLKGALNSRRVVASSGGRHSLVYKKSTEHNTTKQHVQPTYKRGRGIKRQGYGGKRRKSSE